MSFAVGFDHFFGGFGWLLPGIVFLVGLAFIAISRLSSYCERGAILAIRCSYCQRSGGKRLE